MPGRALQLFVSTWGEDILVQQDANGSCIEFNKGKIYGSYLY